MSIFDAHIPKDALHHAYVIEGEESLADDLLLFLESRGISAAGNPDVTVERFGQFGIGESRELQRRSHQTGEKKVFILAVESFTPEAQQSLLKVFEEPPSGVHFFVIVPDAGRLLPTLLSRVQQIALGSPGSREEGEAFLSLSGAERLAAVAAMVKRHEKDDSPSLLKKEAVRLVESLELVLHARGSSGYAAFRELQAARENIPLRGSSVKMILEHLSLIIK